MFRRLMISLLILCLVMPFSANAGMVATEGALHRDRIASVLDRTEVQAQLQAYGVTPGEAKARIAALSEEEAAELAARIDSLPAGGITLVVGILLVLVLLVLFVNS